MSPYLSIITSPDKKKVSLFTPCLCKQNSKLDISFSSGRSNINSGSLLYVFSLGDINLFANTKVKQDKATPCEALICVSLCFSNSWPTS
jgi:hypothetical protein